MIKWKQEKNKQTNKKLTGNDRSTIKQHWGTGHFKIAETFEYKYIENLVLGAFLNECSRAQLMGRERAIFVPVSLQERVCILSSVSVTRNLSWKIIRKARKYLLGCPFKQKLGRDGGRILMPTDRALFILKIVYSYAKTQALKSMFSENRWIFMTYCFLKAGSNITCVVEWT